jgi:cell division protein FtsB
MQINSYQEKIQDHLKRLNDVRVMGQAVFVVIVLMISWSGVKTIQANYNLQKQIASLKQQNDVQQLQNDNLALQDQYYKSDQYLELSARQNFGLGKPGEKEIIVPAKVALAYTIDLPDSQANQATSSQSAYQRNIQSWIDFFLHRQN